MSEPLNNPGDNGEGNPTLANANPHMQRLVIYLNGDQPFLGSAPPDWINSFRSIFMRPASTVVKKHKTEDIIKHLKSVSTKDVDDFPTDCSICLSPFTNIENMDEREKIAFLQRQKNRQEEEMLSSDPPLPIPTDSLGDKAKYLRLKQDEDDYLLDHEAVQIPSCKHIFGKSCITTWLKTNSTCPLCRKDIMNEGRESSATEQDDTIIYPVALSEILIPSTWIEFVPELGWNQDPEISLPTNSQSVHGVSGPRRGPLLDEIQQRYQSTTNNPPSSTTSSTSQNSTSTVSEEDPLSADVGRIGIESGNQSPQGGGPVRSSSRNSNNRSHPYNRF